MGLSVLVRIQCEEGTQIRESVESKAYISFLQRPREIYCFQLLLMLPSFRSLCRKDIPPPISVACATQPMYHLVVLAIVPFPYGDESDTALVHREKDQGNEVHA